MPDLLTHTAFSYFVARPHRFVRYRAIFYLGTILPDIISRPIYILKPELFPYTVGIHTPVFLLLFGCFMSLFFESEIRASIRNWLFIGMALHLFLDFFQRHLSGGGYFWLFPFSWKSFEIGLYWPEQPLKFIPLWLAAILVTEVIVRRRKRA